jgi:hypothetical protein
VKAELWQVRAPHVCSENRAGLPCDFNPNFGIALAGDPPLSFPHSNDTEDHQAEVRPFLSPFRCWPQNAGPGGLEKVTTDGFFPGLLDAMKSYQMFAALTAGLAAQILEDLHAQHKDLYKTALQSAAQALKVRPVFLERQPRAERNRRIAACLGHLEMNLVASNVISAWLIKTQVPMLSEFLDALKIPHDKGVVEDLPPSVEDGALTAAVEALLAKHPQEVVTLYLQAFFEMNEARWPNLAIMLRDDIRLQLPMMV